MRNLPRIATILLIIGGLNWGLAGFFNFDLIAAIFGGPTSALSRIIYSIVGISALYQIFVFPTRYKNEALTAERDRDRIGRAA